MHPNTPQNPYSIICSDIDGTLLNKDRDLSELTIAEIQRVRDLLQVILISSRMPKSMRQLQDQLGIRSHPLIAYNGSLIVDGEEIIQSIELPHSVLLAVHSYCRGTSIHLGMYHHDEWIVPAMDYWANREAHNTKVQPTVMDFESIAPIFEREKKGCHKLMCMGEESEISMLYAQLQRFHAEEINAYRSKATYIEISDKRQDKASALEVLLKRKYPDKTMKEVMAFGDNYNDSTLLQGAGWGVAVQNAKAEVLEIADEVTNSNISDGVALMIRKYFGE